MQWAPSAKKKPTSGSWWVNCLYGQLLLGLFLRLRRGRFPTGLRLFLSATGVPVMTATVGHDWPIPFVHGTASC